MAIIDTTRDVVVVRIVYDGAPAAGKTLSVQALGKLLGKPNAVFTPELPVYPTVYFDWLEYTGGFFKGLAIACQIVSVPTHTAAQPYRDYLLSTADTVVFVADASTAASLEHSLPYFTQAHTQLAAIHSHAPVEMLVQLNKQDAPTALREEAAKTCFSDYPEISFSESIATQPKGIRETFVLAVRLAIDRLNILDNLRQLPRLPRPEINTGDELLELFKTQFPTLSLPVSVNTSAPVQIHTEPAPFAVDELEFLETVEALETLENVDNAPELHAFAEETEFSALVDFAVSDNVGNLDTLDEFLTSATVEALPELSVATVSEEKTASPIPETPTPVISEKATLPSEVVAAAINTAALKANSKRLPKFPDEDTPSQWIWPPLSGKTMLNQVVQNTLKPTLQEDGTWVVNGKNGWRCFSKLAWQYPELERAKTALREQISLHLRCSPLLSEQRCVVIAEERKNWRLWQILHTAPSFEQSLKTALHATTPELIVQQTLACAESFINSYATLHHYPAEFKVSLDNLGLDSEQHILYLGTLDSALPPHAALSISELLTQQFLPVIRNAVQQEHLEVEALVELFAEYADTTQAAVAEQLTELFIAVL